MHLIDLRQQKVVKVRSLYSAADVLLDETFKWSSKKRQISSVSLANNLRNFSNPTGSSWSLRSLSPARLGAGTGCEEVDEVPAIRALCAFGGFLRVDRGVVRWWRRCGKRAARIYVFSNSELNGFSSNSNFLSFLNNFWKIIF